MTTKLFMHDILVYIIILAHSIAVNYDNLYYEYVHLRSHNTPDYEFMDSINYVKEAKNMHNKADSFDCFVCRRIAIYLETE